MNSFPIWAIIGAAWNDVWRNKLSVLRAGWPLLIALLVAVAISLTFRQVQPANPSDPKAVLQALSASGPYFLGQMLLVPLSFCAAALNTGGWARFVARGESAWGFAGRNFGAVIVLKLLLLLVAICAMLAAIVGVAVVAGVSTLLFRGTHLVGLPIAISILALTVGAFVLIVRLSLATVYAAIEDKYDLRGAWNVTCGHGWRLFWLIWAMFAVMLGALLLFALVALLLVGVVALSMKLLIAGMALGYAFKIAGVVVGGLGYLVIYLPLIQWNLGTMTRVYLALAHPKAPEMQNPWLV
jgi:hypothetical protein